MRVPIALLATAACAAAADPWVVARAPHFQVYSDGGADTARSLATGFERLHDFFARQIGVAPRGGAVRVIAFATAQEFAEYRTKPGSDAYYLGATAGDYIVMPAGVRGDLRVPAHEYAHLLLHSTGWRLPAWISEGISEVAGTVRFSDRGATAGGVITGPSQLLRQRRWIPIAELFASRDTGDELFYSQSWALADLLLFSPRYAPGFGEFIAMLVSGSSAETALMSVYRTTPAEFAADAFSRVTHPNPPTPIVLPEQTAAAIHVDPANGEALLAGLRGDIAFGRGDRTEALAQWKRAIDLGTDDPGLCYRYAVLTDDRGAMERAIALDPGFDEVRYKLALLDKSEGHIASAVEHLYQMKTPPAERAFHYWITLGDALLDLDRRAEAKRAAAQAAIAARTDEERKRAANIDWMASTELAVEFDGKQAHTVRVPIESAPARNPFIESGDKAKSAVATLEQVDCADDGSIKVNLMAAGAPLVLSVPDPSRVQIRNAGGIQFEFTCGPQQGRNVLVEYTAAGVLRGLELR
jgi:hypothetical protein